MVTRGIKFLSRCLIFNLPSRLALQGEPIARAILAVQVVLVAKNQEGDFFLKGQRGLLKLCGSAASVDVIDGND